MYLHGEKRRQLLGLLGSGGREGHIQTHTQVQGGGGRSGSVGEGGGGGEKGITIKYLPFSFVTRPLRKMDEETEVMLRTMTHTT